MVYFRYSFPRVRLAIVNDITERLALEEERDELLTSERLARAVAERANRLKDEFLATLSHELRAPLNSILLKTEALRHHLEDSEEVERGLATIDRNTRLQGGLSRICSTVPYQLRQTAAGSAQARSCRDDQFRARDPVTGDQAKELAVRTSFDETIGVFSGDESRLHQVILNLVNNAIKFTPRGGSIDIRLEHIDGHAKISVVDTGQGIQPELLPHLFERFRQGDVKAIAAMVAWDSVSRSPSIWSKCTAG